MNEAVITNKPQILAQQLSSPAQPVIPKQKPFWWVLFFLLIPWVIAGVILMLGRKFFGL